MIDLAQVMIPAGHRWARLPAIGAAVGVVGILLSFALRAGNPRQFLFSWLVAFLFFLSIALGALFFVILHFITNASWSTVLRRLAENVAGTLPLFLLLFVPIGLGLREIYHWSDPDAVAHDHLLAAKAGWLNARFFLIRAGIWLGTWSLMAGWFLARSRQQDVNGDPALTRRMVVVSAPALAVFAVTLTGAAVDWVMSLDPHWYSTIFGVYFFAGCVLGNFAFLALLASALRNAGLLREFITIEHLHDLGKLLFGFTVFWAYIAFCQFFLIWYGNIPEETVWYIHRAEGSWKTASLVLGVGHFGLPFLYLIARKTKRRPALLVAGASWLLAMHFLDLYWLVMPILHAHGPAPSLLDLTTFLGVGGLFVAVIGLRLRRHAMVPLRDPKLARSLSFENA